MNIENYFIPIEIKSRESIIHETLSRIGIANRLQKKLFQTCHLINYKNYNTIIHFKEFFGINGEFERIKMDDVDFQRRNLIIFLLYKWDLIKIDINDFDYIDKFKLDRKLFILSHKEKSDWFIESKVKTYRLDYNG